MSAKEIVLEVIRGLPSSATLEQIRRRIESLSLEKTSRVKPASLGRGLRAFDQAAGMWKDRADLPDFPKLRREWDRS